jgi:hypothetical protein
MRISDCGLKDGLLFVNPQSEIRIPQFYDGEAGVSSDSSAT